MDPDDSRNDPLVEADDLATERQLVEALRRGEVEAGHRFAREYYPRVYRYLLFLTGQADLAADLTQETFLQAWRHLDRFVSRASLGAWLHRIAHREFLQALRARRSVASLEELAELPVPHATGMAESVAMRQAITRLPRAEREAVLLHYLEGYSCAEIGSILQVPASTVKYRLSAARAQLQRELGEGDLAFLNGEDARAITERHGRPPLEGAPLASEKLSRRDFIHTAAGAGAAALAGQIETEVVDERLARQKVTLALKATALADVCEQLRAKSGVSLTARPSVADEKITLFCQKLPLREVMRQLSRPFGYTWVRAGAPGQYRYELEQDLRSQLLEEELRNRDRNQALLGLETEIARFQPYRGLTPDEALERLERAAPAEKRFLKPLAGLGWGPLQMYYRISSQEHAALRSGEELRFSAEPKPGERPLPPEVARGVLQSLRDLRIRRMEDGSLGVTTDREILDARPPLATPEARAMVTLKLRQRELGQFTLAGESGFFARGKPDGGGGTGKSGDDGPLAVGVSPAARQPKNGVLNARLARDPALQRPVAVPMPAPAAPSGAENSAAPPEPRVTTADLLEALHRASGMPLIADYYTRLLPPEPSVARSQPLFDSLNRLADAMRMRWSKEGEWLQFRGATYYDDRLKEVPNRLLDRWAQARRTAGHLTLENLVEIVALSDAQLDGAEMAEGARLLSGLAEWDLARNWALRRHLRYLAAFTPAQREEAQSPTGLAFSRMPLAQQQRFIAIALEWDEKPLQSLDEFEGAVLRVDYTRPGGFEWRAANGGVDWLRWLVPTDAGGRAPRAPIRGRTRRAVLEAARQVEPRLLEASRRVALRLKPDLTPAQMASSEGQIVATELNLTFLYLPGAAHARAIRVFSFNSQSAYGTW